MGLFGLFSKKEPEDYEQVLSSLALDIQKRQTRLSEIRLRERRTTLLLTIYAFAAWVAYSAAWYTGVLPHVSGLKFEQSLRAAPVFIGPIIIQFSRRIVQTWYARIGAAEEKTLKQLLAQQRSKVEEIKKKTNYYSTKNLIERYDATPADSPVRPRSIGPQGPQGPLGTPQRPIKGAIPNAMNAQTPNQRPIGAAFGPSQIPRQQQQQPMVPPRKQWYDKLADALLGDDELGANGTPNRYALICQKCFTHNGLVKEEQWEDAQYVCPKCGHFNPSQRSLKSGNPTSPPTSPSTQSQSRKVRPRKSEPAGPLNTESVSGFDRRKSLPAPNISADFEDDVDERPPVPPLPSQLAKTSAPIDLPSDSDSEKSHPRGEEMEIDS